MALTFWTDAFDYEFRLLKNITFRCCDGGDVHVFQTGGFVAFDTCEVQVVTGELPTATNTIFAYPGTVIY